MKTIQVKLYKFDELSEDSKKKAVAKLYDINSAEYIYEDAHNTVKKFNEIFGTKDSRNSWLDVSTGQIDDCVLNLTGIRLRTYLLNNFYYALYTRKFLGLLDGRRKQRMAINHKKRDGSGFSQIYSNIQYIQGGCPLTGVCYDEDILGPFYDFINNPDGRTFEDLIKDGFSALQRAIENEVEYLTSEKGIIENIIANDYYFTEDGEIY